MVICAILVAVLVWRRLRAPRRSRIPKTPNFSRGQDLHRIDPFPVSARETKPLPDSWRALAGPIGWLSKQARELQGSHENEMPPHTRTADSVPATPSAEPPSTTVSHVPDVATLLRSEEAQRVLEQHILDVVVRTRMGSGEAPPNYER